MTARLVKRIIRPDGGKTHLRGNVQILNNNNFFIDWSSHGYMTELASDGTLLQEVGKRASDDKVSSITNRYNFLLDINCSE